MLSTNIEFINYIERRTLQTGDILQAIKTTRHESEDETVYRLNRIDDEMIPVEFSLPNGIAGKLSKHIDRTERGRKVFHIEIPSIQGGGRKILNSKDF